MRRVFGAVAVLVVASAGLLPAAAKMTPEELVKLHVQALTAGTLPPREMSREVKGTVAAIAPARAVGLLPGTFSLSSSAAKSRLQLVFGTDRYEGETFTLDGDKVDIANAQPREGARSAVGNFVARNRVIVSEGLIGGVLNTRWPLLDVAGRKAKLTYEGLKSLGGRELHRLRYRARDNQGGLDVDLYFDPATYRHVASVYSSSQAQAIGGTPETSSQQSDQYYRIEERFGRFEQAGGLTVPKTWSLRYERSGNTANEWKYDMTVDSIVEEIGNRTPQAAGAAPPRPHSPTGVS